MNSGEQIQRPVQKANMNTAPRILVADEDSISVQTHAEWLKEAGYLVHSASAGQEALELLGNHRFELLISEQGLEDREGLDLVQEVRTRYPKMPVLMVTAFGTIEDGVRATRAGVFDYLTKPVMKEEFLLSVERAQEQAALLEENQSLRNQLSRHRKLDGIIGPSERMGHIFEVVESVAETRATVLVLGESGTGKTLLARTIHEHSDRTDSPFIEVNCGALPDSLLESELFGHAKGSFTGAIRDKAGKFEEADTGTIFLDEIATASPALQIKLLRVLQDRIFERIGESRTRQVDVRILLATNQDLLEQVRLGEFREDLYYRINVVSIELPPLRERPEDIPFLVDHFLDRYCEYHRKPALSLSGGALDLLLTHDWPGNIRELENAIERCVVLSRGEQIQAASLPPHITRTKGQVLPLSQEVLPLKKALEEPEKLIIQRALELNGWNRQQTADMLEVNRTTLFHKMKKYGLLPDSKTRISGA